jgi:hypothetical protein
MLSGKRELTADGGMRLVRSWQFKRSTFFARNSGEGSGRIVTLVMVQIARPAILKHCGTLAYSPSAGSDTTVLNKK